MEDEPLIRPVTETSPEETPVTTTVSKWKWTNLVLAMILLFVYLTFGVLIYSFIPDQFTGKKTKVIVDALYFTMVTFCTVGYGDIAPSTTTTKILTLVLVSMGVVFLHYFLNIVLSFQENAEDGRIRLTWRLFLAISIVCTCVGIGACLVHKFEELNWLDSIYLSVISVSTVGYGDKKFETVKGRGFAVIWLLFSTIAMAYLLVQLGEMRKDRTTVTQLTKSELEFIESKLKESGKFSEDEIKKILTEFENRDR